MSLYKGSVCIARTTNVSGKANTWLDNLTDVGEDRLNTSKMYLTGAVSTDEKGYNQLLEMKHSTFDLSKFTVVGSPTITDDGVASGFSSGNYINTIQLSELANRSWDIEGAFEYIADSDGSILGLTRPWATRGALYYIDSGTVRFAAYIGVTGDATSEGTKIELPNVLTTAGEYYYKLSFNLPTGKYTLSIYNSNKVLINSGEYTPPTTNKQLWDINNNPTTYISISETLAGIADFPASIDLKQFSITVDGKEVFSGNKTGIDVINEIEIPYTLSKTGSKIVDVAYRDRVIDLYDQEGQAAYYTIDEPNKNFTLPMGEIYGMIGGSSSTGVLKKCYPVGSIYMSVNEVNPATLFGFGTWEQIKDKFILSAGDTYANGQEGGSAEVSLSTSQLPAHTHTASTDSAGAHTHTRGTQETGGNFYSTIGGNELKGDGAFAYYRTSNVSGIDWGRGGSSWGNMSFWASRNWTGATSSNGSHTHTVTVNNTGQGEAHSNMPPYLAVNIWKRVA